MQTRTLITALAAAAVVCGARADTQPISAPTGQKSLAATLNVYAFPGAGQDAAKQSKDESECYSWSVTNTGNDPFQVQKDADLQKQQAAQQQQKTQQATQGAGGKGAVGGAVAGTAIGAIAGDAGKGAAIGAGVGLISARSKAHGAQQQASQTAAQQTKAAEQTSAQKMDAFKKAFSACLEAKKYIVKF
jgi:hypothetical protein